MTDIVTPASFEEAAGLLAESARQRRSVRIRGAGTKLEWGLVTAEPDLELTSTGLSEMLEHNSGDLTAVLQTGVRLADAQEAFAREGQMLSLDPPLGPGDEDGATIGGVIATGDSGPLRHRYGSPRDLVLGMTVALSDGTIARSGGKVIKNVAGYDIAKLFSGAFGTLGMILAVSVRLHPRASEKATTLGTSEDPDVLGSAGIALARAPLQLDALDIAWRNGRGGILAACSAVAVEKRAQRIEAVMRDAGLEDVRSTDDDAQLWARQRAGQRAGERQSLARVAARPSQLPSVLRAVERFNGTLIGRLALGTSYIELDPGSFQDLRRELPPGATCVLCDAPRWLREQLDTWGAGDDGPELQLMRRIKQRFDPAGTCNPGVFVGGI
jgi:glycolate oxidase FAD binding subunit